MFVGLAIAIPIGIYSAVNRYTKRLHLVTFIF